MSLQVPKAVIFDFDGVLVNSEIIALHELQNCLREVGITVDKNEMVLTFLGASFEDIAKFISRETGRTDLEDFRNIWYQRLFKRYETELTIMKGARQVLAALDAEGIAYCIASGGSDRRLNFALTVTGLMGNFHGRAFSADSVMRGKPAPDIFLHAAEQLNVASKHCLVIEDAIAGVIGAQAAGIRVVGFVGGDHLNDCREVHKARLEEAGAFATIDNLPEILSFLPST